MYIIIVGGGKVGYYLAKSLLRDGHEVLVLEKEAGRADLITDELGSVCLQGDGSEAATLREAGAERANMVIAVTNIDEDNLVSCQVAKHMFNVPRTIARVGNPKNTALFQKLGIDVVVSPAHLVLEYIQGQLPAHHIVRSLPLEDRRMEIVVVKILSDTAAVGKRVRDLHLPEGSFLFLVIREERPPLVPLPDLVITDGDQVVVVTKPEMKESLFKALTVG